MSNNNGRDSYVEELTGVTGVSPASVDEERARCCVRLFSSLRLLHARRLRETRDTADCSLAGQDINCRGSQIGQESSSPFCVMNKARRLTAGRGAQHGGCVSSAVPAASRGVGDNTGHMSELFLGRQLAAFSLF